MMCLSVSLHYITSLHEAITSSQCFLKNYALSNKIFKVCYIWNQVNAPQLFFSKIFNMVDINALEKNVQSTFEIVNTRKHDMILI